MDMQVMNKKRVKVDHEKKFAPSLRMVFLPTGKAQERQAEGCVYPVSWLCWISSLFPGSFDPSHVPIPTRIQTLQVFVRSRPSRNYVENTTLPTLCLAVINCLIKELGGQEPSQVQMQTQVYMNLNRIPHQCASQMLPPSRK